MALLAAWAVAGGAHPVALGTAALAVARPGWFLAAAAGWGVWSRWSARPSASSGEEAAFLRALAADLTAGASLRAALAGAARRAPGLDLDEAVRLAAAGRPAGEVAAALGEALPGRGRSAALAFRLASSTGAPPAAMFTRLAVQAAEADELARERRAATAQARLSALLVGGAPLVFGVALLASGRAPRPSGVGALLVAVGLALEAAGAAVVWMMLRRAGR